MQVPIRGWTPRRARLRGVGGALAFVTSMGCGQAPSSPPVFEPCDCPGCAEDDSLDCAGSSLGIACPTGLVPPTSQYACSIPLSTAGVDSYCCIPWSGGSGCTDDPTVSCPDPLTWGFTCQNGDTPDQGDDTLVCSSVPGGTGQQYCCTASAGDGGTGTSPTCASDTTLMCDVGSLGYRCTDGATIATYDPTFICSDPAAMSDGSNGYCCITASGTSCRQDDDVPGGCPFPSIGFQCSSPASPATADSSLDCGTGVADPNGASTDFCCE